MQYRGVTISMPKPNRHHTILISMDILWKEGGIGEVLPPMDQGFITNTGRYVNRVEAYYIAHKAEQIIDRPPTPCLYSENLW